MGDKTIVAWTNKTFNPWRGCTKIDPGCRNCYMFTAQSRYGRDPNIVTRTKTWGDPVRWQAEAAREGKQTLVFTCSWSDWFHADADEWRSEAWRLVKSCPNLTFQILTKRADRIAANLPPDWGEGYPNVWLGVSISESKGAWRSDELRKIPARVRFISYEPALGPLADTLDMTGIHWVIAGGESGPGFRPMDLQWARDMRDKCRASGVAYFFKQSAAPRTEMGIELDGQIVREFPVAA
jgi:protein gp37